MARARGYGQVCVCVSRAMGRALGMGHRAELWVGGKVVVGGGGRGSSRSGRRCSGRAMGTTRAMW